MFSWEGGIEFGRMIERLARSERRQDRIEAAVKDLRTDVDHLKLWGGRLWLLIVLWAAALGINLPAEQLGDQIAGIIKLALQLR